MMTNNSVMYSVKIIGELIRDILIFPLWWYSRGLVNNVKGLIKFIIARQKSLALIIWVKNIFTPMYGQTDWQGKLISVFIRIVQIIFRSIVMLFYLIISIALLLFWLALPPFTVYQIIFQFL